MAGNLARISPSGDNIIELDTVRPGRSGRASADRNLCPDLCPDSYCAAGPSCETLDRAQILRPSVGSVRFPVQKRISCRL